MKRSSMLLSAAFVAFCCLQLVGSMVASAQADEQWLAVRFVVCPEGVASKDSACEDRIAYSVSVTAIDSASGEHIVDGVTPSDDGYAWIDITGLTPTSIRVSGDASVGNIGVTCVADGETIPASLTPGAHALAKFEVDAPAAGNVSCTFYLYGTSGADEYLGVVNTGSSNPNVENESASTIDVVALPSTGVGESTQNDASGLLPVLLFSGFMALVASTLRVNPKRQ